MIVTRNESFRTVRQVTYHPGDSSAFYTSSTDDISNAIGYYGATLAWLFVGFLGLNSLLFPAALI